MEITYNNMLNLLLSKATTRGLTHPAAMLFISQSTAVHMGSMTHSTTECVYHNIPSVWGAVSVCTHLAGELCSEEAHNSQRSGCPLDYSEWSVPPSPVAHRFSLRWQRTETGQHRSHANHLHHQQHLKDKRGINFFCWALILVLNYKLMLVFLSYDVMSIKALWSWNDLIY